MMYILSNTNQSRVLVCCQQGFMLKMLQIIIPKLKNEPLGVVIVESGWGSMVPTIVLASMAPGGAAARCSQLNVGDQIMSVNGVSLVGLPLSTCQNYVKVADFTGLRKLLPYFL